MRCIAAVSLKNAQRELLPFCGQECKSEPVVAGKRGLVVHGPSFSAHHNILLALHA